MQINSRYWSIADLLLAYHQRKISYDECIYSVEYLIPNIKQRSLYQKVKQSLSNAGQYIRKAEQIKKCVSDWEKSPLNIREHTLFIQLQNSSYFPSMLQAFERKLRLRLGSKTHYIRHVIATLDGFVYRLVYSIQHAEQHLSLSLNELTILWKSIDFFNDSILVCEVDQPFKKGFHQIYLHDWLLKLDLPQFRNFSESRIK